MSPHDERTAVGGRRLLLESALVFLATLSYLWLFRLYGFDVVDEGTILAQIDIAARGGRPYVDFETGYTPGFFGLHALLWRWTGADLVTARTFGVGLHALTAALLYGLSTRAAGRAIAAGVTILHVAFLLPVSMRFGAHFNIPYPGWLVAPIALVAQAAVASRARRRAGPVTLLVAGLAAGAAFSVKPNAGLLLLAGAALSLPVGWRRGERGAVAASTALRIIAPLATVGLLGGGLDAGYGFAVVAPVVAAALAARLSDDRERESRRPLEGAPVRAATSSPGSDGQRPPGEARRPLLDLLFLGGAFLVPVLPWLLPLCLQLGLGRIASDVLLLDGGGVVAAYLVPYPLPALSTLALVGGLVAAALATGGRRARFAPLLLGIGILVGSLLAEDARLAAENALLWLPPVFLVAGLLRSGAAVSATERAILVFAALVQVQMFPRPDVSHLAQIAPSLWLAGAVTWRRFADAWRRSLPEPRAGVWLARVALGGVALLALGRALPSLAVRLSEPMVPIDVGSRAPLVIAEAARPSFSWLADAVREVEDRTRSGEPVFSFPDLAGIAFLANRPVPFFYLYFVPGRPDREEEHRTVAEIERIAPPLAIVGPPRVAAFRGAEAYFTAVAAALRQHYREVASGEGFRVLARSNP